MKLSLTIESRSLDLELDDVVAGLFAIRLDLPPALGHSLQESLTRHLNETTGPWTLDANHMRRRILRKIILDIADPALLIRYLSD
ncbi:MULTISPECIES: hypothetical protein [unclassified Burkholderia]|uniref:hypothetical protein n=1 Tax=unclassified Burkholderia TaxID=2613784 RepID=UPI001420A3E5|nr:MULTISPECIES: hypothetical protein [unclassified Burkholderia]NIE82392.1 hypothetical protein [Burkholderia sp. Tr-860]NIF61283.1 hypothetical protein [Burkholderia sp. Cy-647]NIF96200.1 hypothetical protein [Burkholderia sp. Ax-1720]